MGRNTSNIIFWVKDFFIELGKLAEFSVDLFKQFFRRPFDHKEMIYQSYLSGNKTFPLVAVTGFIMGLVFTLQSRPVLVDFGAESLLPSMISISIFREIGPMVTALLCAGKISSGYGAEIGAMRVTEQIDAMEVSGTNPMSYLVASRVLASTIMVPILVLVSDAIGIFGSFVAMNLNGSISFRLFFGDAYCSLEFLDIVPATIKTVVFGFIVGVIGCFKGYYSKNGTQSVGAAANSAVVAASLCIFVVDLFVVQLTELIY